MKQEYPTIPTSSTPTTKAIPPKKEPASKLSPEDGAGVTRLAVELTGEVDVPVGFKELVTVVSLEVVPFCVVLGTVVCVVDPVLFAVVAVVPVGDTVVLVLVVFVVVGVVTVVEFTVVSVPLAVVTMVEVTVVSVPLEVFGLTVVLALVGSGENSVEIDVEDGAVVSFPKGTPETDRATKAKEAAKRVHIGAFISMISSDLSKIIVCRLLFN